MDACAGNVMDVCKIGQELLMSVRNFSQWCDKSHPGYLQINTIINSTHIQDSTNDNTKCTGVLISKRVSLCEFHKIKAVIKSTHIATSIQVTRLHKQQRTGLLISKRVSPLCEFHKINALIKSTRSFQQHSPCVVTVEASDNFH